MILLHNCSKLSPKALWTAPVISLSFHLKHPNSKNKQKLRTNKIIEVSIRSLINIQRTDCLDDSFFPNFLWKLYSLFKSAATEKYCQNSWPCWQHIWKRGNFTVSSENAVDSHQCLWFQKPFLQSTSDAQLIFWLFFPSPAHNFLIVNKILVLLFCIRMKPTF